MVSGAHSSGFKAASIYLMHFYSVLDECLVHLSCFVRGALQAAGRKSDDPGLLGAGLQEDSSADYTMVKCGVERFQA